MGVGSIKPTLSQYWLHLSRILAIRKQKQEGFEVVASLSSRVILRSYNKTLYFF